MIKNLNTLPYISYNYFICITDTMYTLLCVDPDVPTSSFGTPDFPMLHWQVANIMSGDVSSGHEVLTYSGPAPLNNQGHTYYFLLYQQTEEVNVTDFPNFTNPIGARYAPTEWLECEELNRVYYFESRILSLDSYNVV